jgi:hypothetical protein
MGIYVQVEQGKSRSIWVEPLELPMTKSVAYITELTTHVEAI